MKELTLYLGNEPLGKVRVESIRGKEVFSFAYAEEQLKRGGVLKIDPEVMPSVGEQFPIGKDMFGFLGDIAPDRWGRRLIRRKKHHRQNEANILHAHNFSFPLCQ